MADLSALAKEMSKTYPRAAGVVKQMCDISSRLLMGQVELQVARHGEAFWIEAERVVGYSQALGGDPLDALLEYTIAYLKAQAQFCQTNEYTHSDFDQALRDVYDNADVMDRYYLHGLLLTHAFWPIHFDIHRFFREEFLSRVPDEGVGTECGYGHGLYLAEVLEARAGTSTLSFDISTYSRNFAVKLLKHVGISPQRYDLGLADVREPLPLADNHCNWFIFAEVLEHIPDPVYALKEIQRCVKPGCPIFVVTVIDSNAVDHLYQFESPDHVRTMLTDCGLNVVTDRALRVRDYDNKSQDPTIDVVYVCTA